MEIDTETDTESQWVKTRPWLKTSSCSYKRQMIMMQEGNILIGSAKYKGRRVSLWLSKVPGLEEIKCAK